jgi:hypothetical protein
MSECVTANIPGDQNIQINDESGDADQTEYRSIVGGLIYASTWTRPDITHAVNMTSRYMHKPTQTHLRASKKILRYMSGTSERGLCYNNNNSSDNSVNVTAYCDSDWAGDKEDRRSTTGYCTFMNGNLINWNTKKQQTVALSSAEAELMAVTEAVKEMMWLKEMLKEMKWSVTLPSIIYSDNQSAVHMTHNDVSQDRSKHIATRHFFVREGIDGGEHDVKWVSTDRQIADIFTKCLSVVPFNRQRDRLVTATPTTTCRASTVSSSTTTTTAALKLKAASTQQQQKQQTNNKQQQ